MEEEAAFWINTKTGVLAVRVEGGTRQVPEVVGELSSVGDLDSFGIEELPPGRYETACGKGYWDCGPDEPESVLLDTPGISLFRPESAADMIFFDKARKAFRRISHRD